MVARAIESAGIPTVLVMMYKQVADALPSPRVCYVRFPFGVPLGEPGNADQQRVIVEDALHLVLNAKDPGTLREMPYRWRREDYSKILSDRVNYLSKPTQVAAGD